MRFLCVIALILIIILEIGPFPISGPLLLYIVLFRPTWVYPLAIKIYR